MKFSNLHSSRSGERGNVLIYILIAIIALTSLSFAVSRSGRESATAIDREKNDLSITEILDFASAVRGSLQNMTIQGVKQNQICFDSPLFPTTAYQYAACSTVENRVFDTKGGNAPGPHKATASILDSSLSTMPDYGIWSFPSTVHVKSVGLDCDPSPDCNEMIAILAPIKENVCININKKMGIANAGIVPVNGSLVTLTPYLGSFAFGSVIDAADLIGKRTGCFKNADGVNMFYAVLVAH